MKSLQAVNAQSGDASKKKLDETSTKLRQAEEQLQASWTTSMDGLEPLHRVLTVVAARLRAKVDLERCGSGGRRRG